jgi:hypothetical protein
MSRPKRQAIPIGLGLGQIAPICLRATRSHTVLSSIIDAMIYRVVFQLKHRFTLGVAVVLVAAAVVVLVVWGRSHDRRRR